MLWDYANIVINGDVNYENVVECNMPRFGTMIFKFYCPKDEIFLKYGDYPLVKAVANSDLYNGINELPYIIEIFNDIGTTEIITKDNITNFKIAVAIRE